MFLKLTLWGYGLQSPLNQIRFLINRPGLFYGQYSEICVENHRFIPIVIGRISTNKFIIRSQEKNLNQNRDSKLGSPDF